MSCGKIPTCWNAKSPMEIHQVNTQCCIDDYKVATRWSTNTHSIQYEVVVNLQYSTTCRVYIMSCQCTMNARYTHVIIQGTLHRSSTMKADISDTQYCLTAVYYWAINILIRQWSRPRPILCLVHKYNVEIIQSENFVLNLMGWKD